MNHFFVFQMEKPMKNCIESKHKPNVQYNANILLILQEKKRKENVRKAKLCKSILFKKLSDEKYEAKFLIYKLFSWF